MQKKRITLIISSLTGGGAENICITIANSFAQNGWIVEPLKTENCQGGF